MPYIGFSGVGALGAQDCSEALNYVNIFTRLSQKTDKSAKTRQDAANNAAYWQSVYNSCIANQQSQANTAAVQAAPAPAPAPTQASTVAPTPGTLQPTVSTPYAAPVISPSVPVELVQQILSQTPGAVMPPVTPAPNAVAPATQAPASASSAAQEVKECDLAGMVPFTMDDGYGPMQVTAIYLQC